MTTPNIIVLVVLVLLVDFVVIGAVFMFATGSLRTLAAKFPARPIAPDAVSKRRQSIGIDLMNYGWSFDIAVDAACLHLTPLRFWRALGATPISIPWESIELKSKGSRWRPATARIGTLTLAAPEWALSLAQPDPPAGSAAL